MLSLGIRLRFFRGSRANSQIGGVLSAFSGIAFYITLNSVYIKGGSVFFGVIENCTGPNRVRRRETLFQRKVTKAGTRLKVFCWFAPKWPGVRSCRYIFRQSLIFCVSLFMVCCVYVLCPLSHAGDIKNTYNTVWRDFLLRRNRVSF